MDIDRKEGESMIERSGVDDVAGILASPNALFIAVALTAALLLMSKWSYIGAG